MRDERLDFGLDLLFTLCRRKMVQKKTSVPLIPSSRTKHRMRLPIAALSSAILETTFIAANSAQNQQTSMETSSSPSLPVLKSTVFLALGLAIPFVALFVEKFLSKHPDAFRWVWLGGFLTNIISVSIPGRFDQMQQQGKPWQPWKTYFEPAGWAFAIWGVIYLSEALLTAYGTISGAPTAVFRDAAPFWLAGNLFQSLWCYTFRPEFRSGLWLPASFLAGGAASMLGAHRVFSQAIMTLGPQHSMNEKLLLLACRFPLALHGTWLAAATLLNTNGWAAVGPTTQPFQLALAFTSAFAAFAIAGVVTWQTKDVFIAATAAWALAALADRAMSKGKDATTAATDKESLIALSMVEGGLSNVLKALVVVIAAATALTVF